MAEERFPSRVFITGANGFIGRSLARYCREQGAEVCGIDFTADPDWEVIAADLNRPEQWQAMLPGVELVFHTAAVVSNTAPLDLAWRVNVKGTRDLLDACAEAGVARFVHLSSVAAYGFDFSETVAEDYPLRPMGNTYVDTKIASEHAVLACHAGGRMACTIVRPGDVYGPGSRPWVILPLEMMRAGKFLLPAHGQGLFSPVYIDDLVAGTVLAAIRSEGSGQVFNISGGIEPTCAAFFSHHARMLGSGPPRTLGTAPARVLARLAGALTRLSGGSSELGSGAVDMLSRKAGYSIEKAGRLLGYEPRVGLEEGMRRTEHWAVETGLISSTVAK